VTEGYRGQRVLVVDDTAGIQALISRALTAHGYHVDVASSLASARTMGPGGYDSLVVDAHLGQDRGTDLVTELISADPGAAARCLVITGGAAGPLPDGVSVLAKPFHPAELLAAVRALHPDGNGADGRTGGAGGRGQPAAAGGPAPTPADTARADTGPADGGAGELAGAGAARDGGGHHSDGLAARELLAAVRGLRAQERGQLVDILHDGPIQDLAAVTLALHLLRGPALADAAEHLAGVRERLDSASRALRSLIDGQWPFLREETRLPEALAQRTGWLLAAPLTLHLRPAGAALPPADVPGAVDLAELMLFTMAAGEPLPAAEVTIGVAAGQLDVELAVPAPEAPVPPGPPGPALAALGPALGGTVRTRFGPERWQAAITVPR
jgi:CheY-like chemotaxis protein